MLVRGGGCIGRGAGDGLNGIFIFHLRARGFQVVSTGVLGPHGSTMGWDPKGPPPKVISKHLCNPVGTKPKDTLCSIKKKIHLQAQVSVSSTAVLLFLAEYTEKTPGQNFPGHLFPV